VQLQCPAGRAWTLSFDGGQYPSGQERRMRSAAGEHVHYALYRDAARQDPIDIDGALAGVGTGAVQTSPVYGRARIEELPAIGQYLDVVVVVLRF
jgi:spore coat protein U-like protein